MLINLPQKKLVCEGRSLIPVWSVHLSSELMHKYSLYPKRYRRKNALLWRRRWDSSRCFYPNTDWRRRHSCATPNTQVQQFIHTCALTQSCRHGRGEGQIEIKRTHGIHGDVCSAISVDGILDGGDHGVEVWPKFQIKYITGFCCDTLSIGHNNAMFKKKDTLQMHHFHVP